MVFFGGERTAVDGSWENDSKIDWAEVSLGRFRRVGSLKAGNNCDIISNNSAQENSMITHGRGCGILCDVVVSNERTLISNVL